MTFNMVNRFAVQEVYLFIRSNNSPKAGGTQKNTSFPTRGVTLTIKTSNVFLLFIADELSVYK